MQRRFTGRDILYFGGLTLLLLTLVLVMYMIDRQWQKMARMEQLLREQAGDLREIATQVRKLDGRLASGATINTPGTSAPVEETVPAAFERAYQASQQADYAEGDWLVRAFGVNLKSLTPFISEDAYASTVQDYVLETLLTRNPESLEWEGLLGSKALMAKRF